MITAKEIAALAGVSRGTVDRALHGRSGINPDVAARILRIAEQHRYAPDRAGRALSSRKNPPNIGVVFHAGDNPFFDAVIDGMRRAQSEYKDFRMELHLRETGGYDAEKQLRHMRDLESVGVQAMIITPVNVPSVAAEIDRLHQRGIPTVCVNSDIDSCLRAAYVGCDYHQSGAVAAGLAGLMASAHMEAGVVIGSLKILGHAQRVSGFNSELKKTGCVTVVGVVENGDDDARSRAAVMNLLRAHRPGLLYFAAGGVAGGLSAVEEVCAADGTPRPLVIACDETPAALRGLREGTVQALVTQQPFEQGYTAVRLAFSLIEGGALPDGGHIYMRNEIRIAQNL